MSTPPFVSGSLLRHILVMTSTATLGLMSIFLVDLVDMYFLSLLGEVALAAAVGYSGSILFFTTSICIGISITMAALVSRSVGAKQLSSARRYLGSVTIFAISLTVPLAAIIWLNTAPLLSLLGATGQAHQLSSLYLRIIIPSMPVLAIAMSMGAVLRAHSKAKQAMLTTITSGLVNAILDPILIFGLDMGVAGAAVASVIARLGALYIGIRYVVNGQYLPKDLTLNEVKADLSHIIEIALPAILTNIATPVGNAYVTMSIAAFGDGAIAGYSVIGRIIPVAFGVVFALSGAIGPIIGQNYGAGKSLRVRQTLHNSLLFTFSVVAAISILLWLIQGHIISLFRAQPDAAALISFFCSFVAISFIFNAAHFIANAAFNNLGYPFWSTLTNWGKATLGTIPFVWLGSHTYGAKGVLAGQAFGTLLFGLLTIIMALRLTRRLAAR